MALKLLDVESFLRTETARQVTNKKSFDRAFNPSKNGLQDSGIFGVSGADRFKTWGYINLQDVVMHPMVYENLHILDPIFKQVQNKKSNVVIDSGKLIKTKDGSGGTGIGWLISNWSNINFDLYRTEKNKMWVDFLNNTNKDLFFIKKIPVIPIAYREATMGAFAIEKDPIDEIYGSLMGLSDSEKSEFDQAYMESFKSKTSKEMLQDKANFLFKHFISQLEGKRGFVKGNLLAKRLDNVARLVANARPDIPIDCAAIPWQILLNLFDVFVVAYINNIEVGSEKSTMLKELGLTADKSMTEYGELFDYIYRNADTYNKHYPKKQEIWVKILTEIFNENPLMRVLIKRDPGWNADSLWCFKPIIIHNIDSSDASGYQIWVPSWVYSPLGGDSFNTDFHIQERDSNILYEDDQYKITGDEPNSFVIKKLDSIWAQLEKDKNEI